MYYCPFIGWTPSVVAVTGDATYKATFKAVKNKYLIIFQNEDGSELKRDSVEYGEMPKKPKDPTKPRTDVEKAVEGIADLVVCAMLIDAAVADLP